MRSTPLLLMYDSTLYHHCIHTMMCTASSEMCVCVCLIGHQKVYYELVQY